MKTALKIQAISLRQDGLSYSEILAQVPVAKSTLSAWLHSVALAKHQQQRLSEKKRLSALRGGAARKNERISRQSIIMETARAEIGPISTRELWLMGAMLYWAEGSKEKKWKTGRLISFTNSDPAMIRVYLEWVSICLHVPLEDIEFELYLHESHSIQTHEHLSFWTQIVGIGYNRIDRVYLKKNILSTKRKNSNSNYHGQLRVTVKKSVDLNRKIAGWIEGICAHCPVV